MFDLTPTDIHEHTGRLVPGYRLALITDGATEAMDPDDAMLGEEGVGLALAAVAGRPPADMAAALNAAIIAFRKGRAVTNSIIPGMLHEIERSPNG